MEQFKLKEGSFKQVRRKWIFLYFPLGLMGLTILNLRFVWRLSHRSMNSISWTFFVVGEVISTIVCAWWTYEALQRERVVCDDYLLTIDQNTITREQFGSDTITFDKDEITKIYKESDGTLVIMRDSRVDSIIVPSQIENQEKLEILLSGIRQFGL